MQKEPKGKAKHQHVSYHLWTSKHCQKPTHNLNTPLMCNAKPMSDPQSQSSPHTHTHTPRPQKAQAPTGS